MSYSGSDRDFDRDPYRTEAGDIGEKCLWGAECHYAAETDWYHWNNLLDIPATILAALAGATGLGDLPDHIPQQGIAAGLSITAAVITALLTFLKPHERANQHHQFAHLFEVLYQDSEHARLVRFSYLELQAIQKELEDLHARLKQIIDARPPISGTAYDRARRLRKSGRGEVLTLKNTRQQAEVGLEEAERGEAH